MSRLKEVFSAIKTFPSIYRETENVILLNQVAFVTDYFENDIQCVKDYLKYMLNRIPTEVHNVAYEAKYIIISNISYEQMNIRFMNVVDKYVVAFEIPSKYKKLENDIHNWREIIKNVLSIIADSTHVVLGGGPDKNKKSTGDVSFSFYKNKYNALVDQVYYELTQNFCCSDKEKTVGAAEKIMVSRLAKSEVKEYILTKLYYVKMRILEGTYIMRLEGAFLVGDKDECATIIQQSSYEFMVFELWMKDYNEDEFNKLMVKGECSDELLDMCQIMCVRNYYSPHSLFIYHGILCDFNIEYKTVDMNKGINSWYTVEFEGNAYVMEARGTRVSKFAEVIINLPGAKQIDDFDCDFVTVRDLKSKFNLGKVLYNISNNNMYDQQYKDLGVNILY